jgi:hypothetical protein
MQLAATDHVHRATLAMFAALQRPFARLRIRFLGRIEGYEVVRANPVVEGLPFIRA